MYIYLFQIEYVTSETDTFFKLPTDIKKSYIRQGDDNNGWISLEQERFNILIKI